jgi:predicted acetyltransferase
MTQDIRRMTDADLEPFLTICDGAYPSFASTTPEAREQTLERWRAEETEPGTGNYGAFDEGRLVGGMRLFDFTMNVFGAQVLTGGVGRVAVDLFHKKQHIARDLVGFFLRYYRERGAPLAALYPFRPDFYHQMGFGYGTRANEYRARPADLPATGNRSAVMSLAPGDAPAVAACYARLQARTHGLFQRTERPFTRNLTNPAVHAAGFWHEGEVRGYCYCEFVSAGVADNFTANDLVVAELLYETPEALHGLLAFLRSQADQARYIIFRNQDAHFSELFFDPRFAGSAEVIPYMVLAHLTNTQGTGIMYRVLDTAAAFRALADHDFGGQTLRLTITVRDTFLPENDGPVTVHFREGRAALAPDGEADAAITLDVADFTTLLLGIVPFATLYRHGRATLSDTPRLDTVTRLFLAAEPPVTLTGF